jgi:GTP-binding protein
VSRFVDETDIVVRSGDGGPGIVSFRREKYVPRGGPDGGDGGDGGDVVIQVKKELRSLYILNLQRTFIAQKGQPGGGRNKQGSKGKDCVIFVPEGTVVTEKGSNKILADLTKKGQKKVIAKGGKGGFGNTHFASSINRAPRYSQTGQPGIEITITLEMKIIADIGVVGLPNAGKSTLLSVLTKARPKIADYPFTTLSPNLGIMEYKNQQQFIIADIPGLIKGAHRGYGLGLRFLKHIERTKVLFVLVDLSSGGCSEQFEVILHELKSYSAALLNKPRIIVGSKRDMVSEREEKEFFKMELEKRKICISSVSGTGVDSLKDEAAHLIGSLNRYALS